MIRIVIGLTNKQKKQKPEKNDCWLNELQGIIKRLIFVLVWSFDKVLITYLLELKKHLKGVYSFPLLHAQVEPLWLLSLLPQNLLQTKYEIRSYLYGRDNNCSAKTKAILNCAHNIMQISSWQMSVSPVMKILELQVWCRSHFPVTLNPASDP